MLVLSNTDLQDLQRLIDEIPHKHAVALLNFFNARQPAPRSIASPPAPQIASTDPGQTLPGGYQQSSSAQQILPNGANGAA